MIACQGPVTSLLKHGRLFCAQTIPAGWSNPAVRKAVLEKVATNVGVLKLEDWYKIKLKDVALYGGGSMMATVYGNSLLSALKDVYPEHQWLPWRLNRSGRNFWSKPQNRQLFLDWLSSELNIEQIDGWYKLTTKLVKEYGGGGLLAYHGDSVSLMLRDRYPDHNWEPWRFQGSAPKGFWSIEENRRMFFDSLANVQNIRDIDGWYKITKSDVANYGSGMLKRYYGDSMLKALKAMHPTHKWLEWRLGHVSDGFWDSADNQREYFTWLGERIGVNKVEDWYDVDVSTVHQHGGGGLLMSKYSDSIQLALLRLFPDHEWQGWRFKQTSKSVWKSFEVKT